ncbi:MAG: PDZ domain-containing protein [Gemmatimonadaceae bacterium]|nr:PDZ domain-containing protein [Gemmatimonadaceae bacterium]
MRSISLQLSRVALLAAVAATPLAAQGRDTTRRVEDIDAEIARLRRDLESLRSQQRAQMRARISRTNSGGPMVVICEQNDRPQGWLGVTFTPPQSVVAGPDGPRLRFAGPIVVEEISPNSPAARAGIAVGDSITVLGTEEVKGNALNFQTLLKPGTTLPVTLRRAGKERSFKVEITQRPGSADGEICRELPSPLPLMRGQNPVVGVFLEGDSGNGIDRVRLFRERAEREARIETRGGQISVMVPSLDVPAPPRPPGFTYFSSETGNAFLFGAQMSALTEDLAELTGVKKGVFVVSVADGSPAASSGLRGADVIQKVGDTEVSSVRELRRAFSSADRAASVSVVRKKKPLTLTVSW